MKVLITGVTGRVGRNVAQALLERGDTVRGLVLPRDPGLEQAKANGIDCVVGDLQNEVIATKAVSEIDAIIHLGAIMLWGSAEHNSQLFDINVRGTFNLLNAAAQHVPDLQRFVLASSDEVYPSLLAKQLPITESHPTEPYSFYGTSKRLSEEMLNYFHRAHNMPTTTARFALISEPQEIIRPDGWLGRFMFLTPMIETIRSLNGDPAARLLENLRSNDETLLLARDANGESYMFHYCDVRDIVQGLLLMLDKKAAVGEVFNLSGAAPFLFDDAIPYLSEKLAIAYVTANIPGRPIRVHHDIQKAQTLLGYAPQFDIYKSIDSALALRKSEKA